jgi:hypothetical protein
VLPEFHVVHIRVLADIVRLSGGSIGCSHNVRSSGSVLANFRFSVEKCYLIPAKALVHRGQRPAVLPAFRRKRCTINANSTFTSVDYELYDDENGDGKVNEVNNIKFTESTPSTAAT